MNTGWMNHNKLGEAFIRAYNELNWCTGVMFWQYVSDINGQGIQKIVSNLMK